MRRDVVVLGVSIGVLVLGGCPGGEPDAGLPAPESTSTSGTTPATTGATTGPTETGPTETGPTSTPDPPVPPFSGRRAMADVEFLAERVGPRLATSRPFRRAARWVRAELEAHGYDVAWQSYPVPAGDSWGVPVEAGTSANVVARPPGFDPGSPYLLVGAHLDTVAVSPGAEDNASGIAVLLETARRAAAAPPPLPVVFVAFGGEEPRGIGELGHHFGSRHYVAQMTRAERRHLRGMVAMDRVGVGEVVPVGSVPGAGTAVRDGLARAAERLGIRTAVGENNLSDHESFADEGMPAARLGSTEYDEYHRASDLPDVVSRDQLQRVGRMLWEWLRRTR